MRECTPQDLLAPLEIRVADGHLTIEPAGTQQRRVEDVRAVGGGHDDDAVGLGEAVHLDEQLVERLLALLVAERVAAAAAAHGVELVDEDDARRVWRRASLNSLRTRDAPTPAYISTNSEPLAEMNGTPASPAIERASSVLPVPGGPTSRMPRGMRPPIVANRAGSFRKSTISCTSSFASSTPATSLNVTVTASGSIVRAFSSVGTRPVTTRNSASPAKPKKIRPSASGAEAADARRLHAVDVDADAAIGEPGQKRRVRGEIAQRRDAREPSCRRAAQTSAVSASMTTALMSPAVASREEIRERSRSRLS